MIELFLFTLLSTVSPEEELNLYCSEVVGIPYASDQFTDEQWNQFILCKKQSAHYFS